MSYLSSMQSVGAINTNQNPMPQTSSERMRIQQVDHASVMKKLADAINFQATQFERYKQLTDRKFTTLSKDLLEMTIKLKEANEFIARIKDKQEVQATREALARYQQGDNRAADKPIDRNGVAPSDVQIIDIFNCSGRRF